MLLQTSGTLRGARTTCLPKFRTVLLSNLHSTRKCFRQLIIIAFAFQARGIALFFDCIFESNATLDSILRSVSESLGGFASRAAGCRGGLEAQKGRSGSRLGPRLAPATEKAGSPIAPGEVGVASVCCNRGQPPAWGPTNSSNHIGPTHRTNRLPAWKELIGRTTHHIIHRTI